MPPRRQSKAMSADHAALGVAIRKTRERLGLTQEAVADRSGLHPTHVGGLERGTRNPTYSTLLKLAGALETSVGSLAARAEELQDELR